MQRHRSTLFRSLPVKAYCYRRRCKECWIGRAILSRASLGLYFCSFIESVKYENVEVEPQQYGEGGLILLVSAYAWTVMEKEIRVLSPFATSV